jgi:hypothetical protein
MAKKGGAKKGESGIKNSPFKDAIFKKGGK